MVSDMKVSPPTGKATPAHLAPPVEFPTPYLNYRTKTELRLPFDGSWVAFWAGRDVQHNYHAAYPDQRFAYDLVDMKPDGKTFTGNGKQNSQFLVWNRPLLAPGGGTIIAAVDGVEDNTPGAMNAQEAFGNHVVIDHGNGEFSFLAHMRKGTVSVHEGDKVKPGTPLGRTGNSGNSSEPHLHYHLQNSPTPFEGDGLPAQFQHYNADGGYIERGEPGRFHSIQNVEPIGAK